PIVASWPLVGRVGVVARSEPRRNTLHYGGGAATKTASTRQNTGPPGHFASPPARTQGLLALSRRSRNQRSLLAPAKPSLNLVLPNFFESTHLPEAFLFHKIQSNLHKGSRFQET